MNILPTKQLLVHDIECAINWFYDLYVDLNTGKQYVIEIFNGELTNDSTFESFFHYQKWLSDKDKVFINYNGLKYDSIILSWIQKKTFVNETLLEIQEYLYKLSCLLGKQMRSPSKDISNRLKPFKDTIFTTIDLLQVLRQGRNLASLKRVGVNLKHPKIQELPFNPDIPIKGEMLDIYKEYQKNDIEITKKILFASGDRIKMREVLGKQFGINIMSSADSEINKIFLTSQYSKELGVTAENFIKMRSRYDKINVKSILPNWAKFKTEELNFFLKNLSEKVIDIKYLGAKTEVTCDIPQLIFGGLKYNIKLGGIHSDDGAANFTIEDDEVMYEIDVSSQYPIRILEDNIVPAHLKRLEKRLGKEGTFLKVFKWIVDTRLYHKSRKNISEFSNIIQQGLKISVNGTYGLYGYPGFWLYDRRCVYQTTMANQLGMLMLIEELFLNNIEILTANTDGVVVRHKKDKQTIVDPIVKNWEKTTKCKTEYTQYKKYIRTNVNNYFCLYANGDYKVKGYFSWNWKKRGVKLMSGFKFPVIAKAIQEYLINGTDPEDYIKNHNDIYDFCSCDKIDKKFTMLYETFEEEIIDKSLKTGRKIKPKKIFNVIDTKEVQSTCRFYISKDSYTRLRKVKIENGKKVYSFLNRTAKKHITLFNNYFDSDDYKIDYDFYIKEANKIIDKIK